MWMRGRAGGEGGLCFGSGAGVRAANNSVSTFNCTEVGNSVGTDAIKDRQIPSASTVNGCTRAANWRLIEAHTPGPIKAKKISAHGPSATSQTAKMRARDGTHTATLGLLLLLPLFSVVYISDGLMTFHVYFNQSIPDMVIAQEFYGVNTRCDCRVRCEALVGCSGVTAVKNSSGGFDCLLTTANLTGLPLVTSSDITLIDKDGYIPMNMEFLENTLGRADSRFFLSASEIRTGDFAQQRPACQAEGGEPAILTSAAAVDEVFSVFGRELFFGGAWVPLFNNLLVGIKWTNGSNEIPYPTILPPQLTALFIQTLQPEFNYGLTAS
ncbi:uncharacterized protein LOC125030480 [Penaeus chinensis]|uniref:uncharacterized protein LOC125030480 n=1 Tax=Penaeus chinensis TaxID=139456 RepID=UPI001FB5E0B9|nr:uncharacterized protein LOC125030480 [Penaeus chinensis]